MIPALRPLAFTLAMLTPIMAHTQTPPAEPLVAQGEYVFRIGGCGHCHSVDDGEPLAGGRPLETPFGTFYTPNITAHRSEGIGAWSNADFRRALRHGQSPDGSDYYPAFPFTSYTQLRAEDIDAMFAYILSRPASDQANRQHDLAWFVSWRLAAKAWKWLFFDATEFRPQGGQSEKWNRGAYIAEAMGHCGECHTPRNLFGALDTSMAYAGNPQGPDDELVPNITSHETTGIGDWSRDELTEFLKYGELPNGEYAVGSMEPVLEGMNYLTDQDRDALTEYLRSLAPIDNRVSQ